MKAKKLISYDRLREILSYNKETGNFTWITGGRGRKVGGKAGSLHKKTGYIGIFIDGKRYQAHRLAWLYVYGVEPEKQIDHINRLRDDNRIVNLREATNQENSRNQCVLKNNSSGITGVYWCKRSKRWEVKIKINGRNKHLGYYLDKEDAAMARLAGEIKYKIVKSNNESSAYQYLDKQKKGTPDGLTS